MLAQSRSLRNESIQKQLLTNILQLFQSIQSKIPVLESHFNKFAGLQLSCEYCHFFQKKPPVVPFEKFINFPGKHKWQWCNRFIFVINTTE